MKPRTCGYCGGSHVANFRGCKGYQARNQPFEEVTSTQSRQLKKPSYANVTLNATIVPSLSQTTNQFLPTVAPSMQLSNKLPISTRGTQNKRNTDLLQALLHYDSPAPPPKTTRAILQSCLIRLEATSCQPCNVHFF